MKAKEMRVCAVVGVIALAVLISTGCGSTATVQNGQNPNNPPGPASISANPASLDFGTVTVGGSKTLTVTITNSGGSSVTVNQITSSGSGFSVVNAPTLPATLNAGASISASIKFAPSAAGATTGNISATTTSSETASIALSGTGAAAQATPVATLSLSTNSLSFGSVAVGSSKTLTVTVSNTGNASASVSAINVTGSGFSVTPAAPLTISVGGSTTLNVKFAPTASGTANGSVSIVSNASNSPTSFSASGSGTAAAAHSVDLSWAASTSVVGGYNLYRSSSSGGPYSLVNSTLIAGTSFTDNAVTAGKTYFYVVTAVDSSKIESLVSNEVQAVIPTP